MPEGPPPQPSVARLVPTVSPSSKNRAALWNVLDRFAGHVGLRQLRNLVLAMIYLQATDKSSLDASNDTSDDVAVHLESAARRLALQLPDIRRLDATALSELWKAVARLVAGSRAADVFLLVLDELSDGIQGDLFTPRSVVSILVGTLDIEPGSVVYDPASRNGELLSAAAQELQALSGIAGTEFRSTALNPEFGAITSMNLELNSIRTQVDVTVPNSIPGEQTWRPSRILSNPPFNMKAWNAHPERRWRYGNPPQNNANYAYLQDIVERLPPGGRAGVVMTNAALSSGREQSIRAGMVDDGCIEALISLPPKLFRGTGIAVTIWLLKPPESPVDEILFIDASGTGCMIDRTLRALGDAEVDELTTIIRKWRSGEPIDHYTFACSAPLSAIHDAEYNLNPAIYMKPTPRKVDTKSAEQAVRRLIGILDDEHKSAKAADHTVDNLLHELPGIEISPPGEWPMLPLGDICEITPGAPTSDDPHGTVPVAKPKNIASGRLVGPTDHVDITQVSRRSSYRIRRGDILCTRTGTVGRIALASDDQEDWIFGTGLIRIRPLSEVDATFLSHYLTHPDVQDWFARNAKGSPIQSINAKMLHTLPVQLPPLRDQIVIGRALHTVDEKILAHERIQTTTRELRETLLPVLLSGHTVDAHFGQAK